MIVFLILLAVIAPIVVVTPLQDAVALPKLATTATLTGAALVWGAVLLARDRWPVGRWPATIWLPLAAFLLVNVLALIFAADWRTSLLGETDRYQGLLTTLLYLLLFGLAAVAVRTTRDLRWLLLGLFFGALGAAIYALIQKAGLDWVAWEGRSADRPFGTLGQANVLGAFLVVTISTSAFLALTAKERWQQAALGAGVMAMLFALLFTLSRSAYLAMGVVSLVWGAAALRWFLPLMTGAGAPEPTGGQRRRRRADRLVSQERQRRRMIGAGVGLAAAVPLILALLVTVLVGLPQGRVAVLSGENSEPLDARVSLWVMALEMAADEPLLGHGHDGFSVQFPSYRDRPDIAGLTTRSLDPESSHNFFLDLLVNTGVLGLLTFVALVGAILWHAGRRALSTDDASLRLVLVAVSAGLLGYLAAISFGFSESMTTWVFWLLLGSVAGLLANAGTQEDTPQDEEAAKEAGTLSSAVIAIAVSFLGVFTLAWAGTLVAADLAAAQSIAAGGRGEYTAAARLAGRAATLNPIQRSYRFQEGVAFQRAAASGEIDPEVALQRAIASFEKIGREYEPTATEMFQLGVAALNQARALGAEELVHHFVMALELDPANELLQSGFAVFNESGGLEDDAVAYLGRAIEINPSNEPLQHAFAAYFEGGDVESELIDHLERAVEIDPSNEPLQAALAIYHRSRSLEEAISYFTSEVELDPSNEPLQNALTSYAEGRRLGREAIGYFARAVALDPFNGTLQNALAEYYESRGLDGRALLLRNIVLGWALGEE